MASDVKLDGDTVRIEGRVVHCNATDFILDNPERRQAFDSDSEHRRALVHDSDGGLTINYDGDYPHVTFGGPVRANALAAVESIASPDILRVDARAVVVTGTDLILDSPDRRDDKDKRDGLRRALVHDTGDALTINYAGDYAGGVRITGPLHLGDLDVADVLTTLLARIEMLERRLEAVDGVRDPR